MNKLESIRKIIKKEQEEFNYSYTFRYSLDVALRINENLEENKITQDTFEDLFILIYKYGIDEINNCVDIMINRYELSDDNTKISMLYGIIYNRNEKKRIRPK